MNEKPILADIYRTIKKPVLILLGTGLRSKAPIEEGWPEFTYEHTQSSAYQHKLNRSTNIGVVLGERSGGLCAIDCDTKAWLEWFLEKNPKLANSFRVVGARGAQIYLYVEGKRPNQVHHLEVPEGHFLAVGAKKKKKPDGMEQIGEFRAEGGQSVLVGKHPNSTRENPIWYQWPVDNPPITIAFEDIIWHPDIVLPWASRTGDAKAHSSKQNNPGDSRNGNHEADEESGNREAIIEATKIVSIDFLWEYFGFPQRKKRPNGEYENPIPSPFRDDNTVDHDAFSIYWGKKDTERQRFKDHNSAYSEDDENRGDSYDFYQRATNLNSREAFRPFMQLAEALKNGETVPPYSDENLGSSLYLPASYSRAMEPGAPLIGEEAYIGFAGEWVKATEHQTECNRGNLLLQFLVTVGVLFGRHFYNYLGQNLFTNLFLVMLGPTGAARKGTALTAVKQFVALVAPEWRGAKGGWKSGEALIHFARDPVYGTNRKHEQIIKDEGVADKRILVEEPELIHLFKTAEQRSNTLTARLREAWDSPDLMANTCKGSPETSTAPHISSIGHMTKEEFLQVDPGLISNGLINRMLWGDAFQARKIANPQPLEWSAHLLEWFRDIYSYAYHPPTDISVDSLGVPSIPLIKHVPLDANAQLLWEKIYLNSPPETGTLAAVLERFFPQTRKVANIYAVLDKSPVITRPHLEAGFAITNHSKAYAKIVFANFSPNENANRILAALRRNPEGLSLTQISSHVFNRKASADDIHEALIVLHENKLASRSRNEAVTKPVEIWRAI